MSTVLLMTDTWHPTVLRLVPFSSNNAKLPERKPNGRQPNARGFPVLAVTRSGNRNNSRNSTGTRSAKSASTRSVQSARSDHRMDERSEASTVTTRRAMTDRCEDFRSKHKRFPQKKIPVTHSEMKEAIKFSVQDLNDQMSTCSSMQSTEESDSKEQVQKVDSTRTSLPKPSLCSPHEAKYFSPINGVRRSVPLTPGEMELQRFRENYVIEQAQRRKKYKLNVNQLPRSNTPINDHDPDKLNMKQVIAFLQTKTSKDGSKKSSGERKCENYRPCAHARKKSGVSTVSIRQKSNVYEEAETIGNSETKHMDKTDSTRETNGCVSVLSTKSTPNLPYGHRTSRREGTYASMSVRSYGNKSKDTKSSSRNKPAKEFKLYRFLAVAPEGERRQGLTTAVAESVPNVDVTPFIYRSQKSPPDSPRKFLRKRARDSTTANLIHRRAVNKNGSLMSTAKDESTVPIRLPSMGDSPDEDSDSCSTTSATYNSTKNGSTHENMKLPKKEKPIAIIEEKRETKENNRQECEDENNNSMTNNLIANFQAHGFRSHDFSRVSMNAPRHIHVNMPQENKKPYSQEIVRLTLRQERSTTRVTSYMSDIQSNSPDKWHEFEKSELTQNPNSDNRDWDLSTSRQLVNTVSNNNFIKVRQKLKSSSTSS